jgi:hypothetical protein
MAHGVRDKGFVGPNFLHPASGKKSVARSTIQTSLDGADYLACSTIRNNFHCTTADKNIALVSFPVPLK